MSWTLTATTRPPATGLRGDAASRTSFGGQLPILGNGAGLMAVEAQEPPRKRMRLSDEESADNIPPLVNGSLERALERCLAKQVFPHVDAEIAKIPGDTVGIEELATEVIGALTGNDFTAEFERLKGHISAEFERTLALRAQRLVWDWSKLSRFRPQLHPPPSSASQRPLPDRRPVETRVPVPRIPTLPRQSTGQAAQPIPTRPPSQPTQNGASEPNRSFPILLLSSSPKEETPASLARTATSRPVHTENTTQNWPAAAPSPHVEPDTIPEDVSDDGQGQRSADRSPSASPPRTPPPVLRSRTSRPLHNATSPKNFRSRAHALAWRDDVHGSSNNLTGGTRTPGRSRWLSLDRRPYICRRDRGDVFQGAHQFVRLDSATLRHPFVFHVDFTQEEIQCVQRVARRLLGRPCQGSKSDAGKDLVKLLKRNADTVVPELCSELSRGNMIKGRTYADLAAFLTDLTNRDIPRNLGVLSLERDDYDRQASLVRSSRVHSLLLAREVAGQRGYGSMRRLEHFTNEFKKCREDNLELRSEWTDCAGDIATITWVSNDGFICGTTEHSDSHNQQYNKPGNLVLGSCSRGTLRSYPDHRVVRPLVQKGENSTDAMRQSQDPWLYASVVSSDYDPVHDRAFTSGFDRTVRIWRAEKSGASMSLLGTWPHAGNVNFVVASKHETGMVATAADVPTAAVRIYHVNRDDIANSTFRSYSCSRVVDLEGNIVPTDKWAYFPATIQWGLSPEVKHLLLVGYSPRSLTADDNDIPEDRRDSGEICLWNGLTGERWRLTSATTQNVFEVLWHPSQPSFIAATSPQGLDLDVKIRTQIRVFRIADNPEYGGKAFTAVQTLDCAAVDINELTIKPNSFTFCYITAGCTDGNTYIWDTARGDKPIHILRHSDPVEEFRGDREKEDTGVKFTAWGNTPDRFYTGSSDGVVKVWNVRSSRKPLVRDILEVPAPVSFGMFSPDRSKLVVGDASGRVFLLSVDEEDQKPAAFTNVQLPGTHLSRNTRRPKLIIPHPEPDPPATDANGNPLDPETGQARAEAYLKKGQILLHRNLTVGAVQGPNYAETGLFCREAHSDENPANPLLARIDIQQQESVKMFPQRRRDMFLPMRGLKDHTQAERLHMRNLGADLDMSSLSEETLLELQMSRVDLDTAGVPYDFSYDDDETIDETEM